jgi:hypothetical protein
MKIKRPSHMQNLQLRKYNNNNLKSPEIVMSIEG